jgi:hypothetical protein
VGFGKEKGSAKGDLPAAGRQSVQPQLAKKKVA